MFTFKSYHINSSYDKFNYTYFIYIYIFFGCTTFEIFYNSSQNADYGTPKLPISLKHQFWRQ